MSKRGFSLIETVLYIGLLAILVPSFILITLGYLEKSETVDPRIRMEEKAAMILSEFQQELTQATSVDVTNSSFGSDSSSFVFIDSDGVSVTVERVNDTVTFVGGDQQVSRLQRQTLVSTDWITDRDMEVEVWNVDVVRNDEGVLTGVNVGISLRMLNPDGSPYRSFDFTTDTTISLQPFTTEL